MRKQAVAMVVLTFVACANKQNAGSTKFSANDNAQNAFLMIAAAQPQGSQDHLAGVVVDHNTVPMAMKKIPSFQAQNFATVNDFNGSVLTSQRVTSELVRISASLTADSTLMVYYSGHGVQGTGAWLFSNNQTVSGQEFVNLINQALSGKKIKRLVVASDSCFAGAFANNTSQGAASQISGGSNSGILNNGNGSNTGNIGSNGANSGVGIGSGSNFDINSIASQLQNGPISLDQLIAAFMGGGDLSSLFSLGGSFFTPNEQQRNDAETVANFGQAFSGNAKAGGQAWDELLFMAASTASQTSADMGAGGGAFSANFTQVMNEMYARKDDATSTIGNFVSLVKQRTTTQTPVTLLSNQAVANEKLFDAGI